MPHAGLAPSPVSPSFVRGRTTTMPAASAAPDGAIEKIGAPTHQDAIKYILHTGIGGSPRVLGEEVRVMSGKWC